MDIKTTPRKHYEMTSRQRRWTRIISQIRDQEDESLLQCTPELRRLRGQLMLDFKEEKEAANAYGEKSLRLSSMKLPGWAAALKSMSNDERTHAMILETIIEVITESCGD